MDATRVISRAQGCQLGAYRTRVATPSAIAAASHTFDERVRCLRSLGTALGAHVVDMLDDERFPQMHLSLFFRDSNEAFDLAGQLQDDAREYRLNLQVFRFDAADETGAVTEMWSTQIGLSPKAHEVRR